MSCEKIITIPTGNDGYNAFTKTTASFIQPAVGANVTISVSNLTQYTGSWAMANQTIFVEGAGYYTVVSSTATSIVVTNLGYVVNTAVGATIASGKKVGPAGVKGSSGEYKVYTAIITQASTGAPTVTVLGSNTIGSIVWTRSSAGQYVGTLTGAFVSGKTWLSTVTSNGGPDEDVIFFSATTNTVGVWSYIGGVLSDDLLTGLSLEIRVYN